jgi:hexosaminidase
VRRFSRLPVAAGLGLALAGFPDASRAVAPTPFTVPALQRWTPAAGAFVFTSSTRVVVSARSAAADDLARDLSSRGLGQRLPVVGARPRTGDVVLALTRARSGSEAYRLVVGRTIRVEASSSAGLYYGTQTVLQLGSQSRRVPAGTAVDRPVHPFRGVMIDAGRKYWSVAWLRNLIRQMAYQKYNVLHLHLSDNQGFRIESTRHPEVVSAQHLTKAQVRALIAYAARLNIEVVPEIDSPGHMQAVLAKHPDLQITTSTGRRDGANLDFVKPAARRLVRELIEEYVPLFPGKRWHIGGDEFVFTSAQWANYPGVGAWAKERYGEQATPEDAFYDYVNWLAALVIRHGKVPHAWSGQLGGRVVRLDPRVVNEVWHSAPDFATADQLAAAGHAVVNCMFWPTYYVLSPQWYARPDRPIMKSWYEEWTPARFDNDVEMPLPAYLTRTDRLRGGKLHVWADSPDFLTEEQVAVDLRPRLRVMSQLLWGSPKVEAAWLDFTERSAALPDAP